MTQLTNEMIIQSLNKNFVFMRLDFILSAIILLVFGIIYFLKGRREQNSRRKKGIIIGVIFIAFLMGVPAFKNSLKYSAIQSSIKNNCFEVVIDTVARTDFTTADGDTTYYVYLTNNGKMPVSQNTYYHISSGDSVYVVIAKGRFGGKYPTGQLYLTSEYQYVNN
ncbi:MAG: hypothetical protein ACLS90_02440 [Clostridia bacterium]